MRDPHRSDIFYSTHLLLTECRKMENTLPYCPAPQSTHSDLDAPWCFKVHPSGNSDKAYALGSLGSLVLVHWITHSLGHCIPTPGIPIRVTGVTGSLVHSFTHSLGHCIPTPGIRTRVTGVTGSLDHSFTRSLHPHTRHTH